MAITFTDEIGQHQMTLLTLVQEYMERFGDLELFEGKDIKFIIPVDIKATITKYELPENISGYSDNDFYTFGGRMMQPTEQSGNNFVLIFQNYLFETRQYFSTVYHELTHVVDFINYFKVYGNVSILDEATKHSKFYYEFYIWTEYNAKKIGLERFIEELNKDGSSIDLKGTIANFINDDRLQSQYLVRVYELVHFFARIGMHDKNDDLNLADADFPTKFIIDTFGSSSLQLYFLLKTLTSFDDFENNKEIIRDRMNEIHWHFNKANP